mgnify:CR=1 FL=1
MKKYCVLLLTSLITLTGCKKPVVENMLKTICPTGAPSIAFYKHANDSLFETNNNVTNITAYLNGASDYDVVVVDTTSGITALNAGAKYKIAATITLGNFYLVSTSVENTTLDKDDVVVLFGNPNAVPYKIFTYLYGTEYKTEFCGGGVDKAAAVLETGINLATSHKADWVYVAEPYLYRAKNNEGSIIKGKNVKVINIQELYKVKSNNLPLMQASVFIKNTIPSEDGKAYLKDLKNDIESAIKDSSVIGQYFTNSPITETKFGCTSTEAIEIMKTNGLGLGFLDCYSNKEAIDSYISLFGMEKTNEEIYFK